MDRKKEESEKLIISESLISPTNPTTTATTTTILTTTNDDDTSSESFETWTLVHDKTPSKDKSDECIEILPNSENEEEGAEKYLKDSENENFKNIDNEAEEVEIDDRKETSKKFLDILRDFDNEFVNDEFSDGISIISESESTGRISPNPSVGENVPLNPLHIDNVTQLRQRNRSAMAADFMSTHSNICRPVEEPKSLNYFCIDSLSSAVMLALNVIKRGLTCTFYVGVGIALLGFFGNIFNPTWQPLHGVMNRVSSLEQLQQKITNMELQNNLMRAEIDLLDKHVRYLKDKDSRLQSSEYYKKEGKAFKAWSGNGDSLKPVDITKDDLKKPYKCPDGSFVEIANMCMEQQPSNKPSIVDQFGHVVENLKEKSESFKTFEQVAEELHGFDGKFFEQLQQEQDNTENKNKQFEKNKPIYDNPKYQPKSEESKLYATHQHGKAEGKNNEYKKFYGKNDSKQKYSKEDKDSSVERKKYKIEQRGSHETNHFKIVGERHGFNHPQDDDSDEEEWLLKHMKYREELREKNKSKGDYKSGEWRDKKHTEQQGKNKRGRDDREREQQRNKRGDSRENKRSGEKRFR